MKSYIRDLDEPVLTRAGFPLWLTVNRTATSPEERLTRFKKLLSDLPAVHLATLRCVVLKRHLLQCQAAQSNIQSLNDCVMGLPATPNIKVFAGSYRESGSAFRGEFNDLA